MLYALRISLPDEPGTLGSVATALSAVGADIVHLRVIDRDGRHAFDEICVETEGLLTEDIREAVEAVPGVMCETLRRISRAPDPLEALDLADRLARGEGDPLEVLLAGLPEALPCTWAMALASDGGDLEVLSATPEAPPPGSMDAPWLPLVGARRLEVTERMPPRWRMHRYELAAAPLESADRFVMIGRPTSMRVLSSELRQLELLTDMAVHTSLRSMVAL